MTSVLQIQGLTITAADKSIMFDSEEVTLGTQDSSRKLTLLVPNSHRQAEQFGTPQERATLREELIRTFRGDIAFWWRHTPTVIPFTQFVLEVEGKKVDFNVSAAELLLAGGTTFTFVPLISINTMAWADALKPVERAQVEKAIFNHFPGSIVTWKTKR